MWGSYGSYSSLSSNALSAPMDIVSSSGSLRIHDAVEAHCVLPSWPRRSSLSSEEDERPSLYLSDDDLLACDVFEDDARSVSSGSSGFSPAASPVTRPVTVDVLAELEREQSQLEARKQQQERERRMRQQQMMQQMMGGTRKPRKNSAKKSPKPKLMAPIAE